MKGMPRSLSSIVPHLDAEYRSFHLGMSQERSEIVFLPPLLAFDLHNHRTAFANSHGSDGSHGSSGSYESITRIERIEQIGHTDSSRGLNGSYGSNGSAHVLRCSYTLNDRVNYIRSRTRKPCDSDEIFCQLELFLESVLPFNRQQRDGSTSSLPTREKVICWRRSKHRVIRAPE